MSTTTSLQFLNAVLPTEGLRVSVSIKNKVVRQKFHETNEQLIATLDAADKLGADAYFATASFAGAGNRKAENALLLKAFRFDVDAGPGKAYATARDAAKAALVFADALGVSISLVSSGGGCHAYIVLDEPIAPDTWLVAARQLQASASANDFIVDTTTTCDPARILRLPETHNYKSDPPKLVKCGGIFINRASEVLAKLGVNYANGETLLSTQPGIAGDSLRDGGILHVQPPALSRSAGSTLAEALRSTISSGEPSSIAVAAERCEQLRRFRDEPASQSEPEWYACIGVAAHCTDGRDRAHAWGVGYPSYTATETDRKLGQIWAGGFGPTTCATFADTNPAGCVDCPQRGLVTSPIQLGRDSAPVAVPKEELPTLPFPFEWSPTGALTKPGKEKGEPPIVVVPYPVYLYRLTCAEIGENAGLVFRIRQHDGSWKEATMTLAAWEGRDKWSMLGRYGVVFHETAKPNFRQYVVQAITKLRKEGPMVVYEQFGWKRDADTGKLAGYLAGEDFYESGTGNISQVGLTQELRGFADNMRPRGSADVWLGAVRPLFADGREATTLTVLAGFAAPLMPFCTSIGGGVQFSVFSTESGTGKSFATRAASTIYGNKDCLTIIRTDTDGARRAKNRVAGFGFPLIQDDVHDDDKLATDLQMREFTSGMDRGRCEVSGTFQHRPSRWTTIKMTNSNKSMIGILGSGTGEDAMAMRLFEVEQTQTMSDAEMRSLLQLMDDNAGSVRGPWLSYLTRVGPERLAQAVSAAVNEYSGKYRYMPASGSYRFRVAFLAVLRVTVELLIKGGFLVFDKNRIMNYALTTQTTMAVDRAQTTMTTLDGLNAVIADVGQHMLVVDTAFSPSMIRSGKACRILNERILPKQVRARWNQDTGQLLIDRDFLIERFRKHGFYNITSISRELIEARILINSTTSVKRVNLSAGLVEYRLATIPVWEIDGSHPLISGTLAAVKSDEIDMRRAK